MGNQFDGCACSASRLPATRVGPVADDFNAFGGANLSRRPGRSGPKKSVELSHAEIQAAEAEEVRRFMEHLSGAFPSLKEAADSFGVAGGRHIDADAFAESSKCQLGFSVDSALSVFHLIDERRSGLLSEFDIAQLFTGPELLRNFERQLKGKISTSFVAFNRLQGGGRGGIARAEFRRFLQETLGYTSEALMDNLFDFIDLNGDEGISVDEFRAFWNSGCGAPPGWFVSPLGTPDSSPKTPNDPSHPWVQRTSVSRSRCKERAELAAEDQRSQRSSRRSQRSERRSSEPDATPKTDCSFNVPERRRRASWAGADVN